jgi:hypothetical protein
MGCQQIEVNPATHGLSKSKNLTIKHLHILKQYEKQEQEKGSKENLKTIMAVTKNRR